MISLLNSTQLYSTLLNSKKQRIFHNDLKEFHFRIVLHKFGLVFYSYIHIYLLHFPKHNRKNFSLKNLRCLQQKGRGICSFYPIVQRSTYQYLWTNAKFGLNKKRKCKNAHHVFYSYVGWKLLKCMICREMIWTTPSSPPFPAPPLHVLVQSPLLLRWLNLCLPVKHFLAKFCCGSLLSVSKQCRNSHLCFLYPQSWSASCKEVIYLYSQ